MSFMLGFIWGMIVAVCVIKIMTENNRVYNELNDRFIVDMESHLHKK